MMQPRAEDERVLDYVYGELGAEERAAFEAQLDRDSDLRAAVESLQGVRRAYQKLPAPEQSAESVARMTALLMQQAAQGPSKVVSISSAQKASRAEGLKRRGLRRLFQSPASGIFAAAAAALFWVVLKSQQAPPVAPEAPAMLQPAEKIAMLAPSAETAPRLAAAPPASGAVPAMSEKNTAPPSGLPLKEAFVEALSKAPAKPTFEPRQPPVAAAHAAPVYAAAQVAHSGKGQARGGLLTELDDLSSGKAKKQAAEESGFVTPPPPEPPAAEAAAPAPAEPETVKDQMAAAQNRHRERIVETLAQQQELGGAAGAPAAPRAAPQVANAPASTGASVEEAAGGQYADNQIQRARNNHSPGPDAPPAAPVEAPRYTRGAGPQRASNTDTENSSSALVAAVQMHLQKGRCSDAYAALQRLEQSFAGTSSSAEMRAQWQRACQSQAPAQNQAPLPVSSPAQNAEPSADGYGNSRNSLSSLDSRKAVAPRAKKAAPSKAADSAARR